MQVKNIIKKLESSEEFKKWKKDYLTSSLAHIFKMNDEANKDDWQIGFYNPNDTITTFVIKKDSIDIIQEAEIFKKPDTKIQKLPIDEIKIDIDHARNIVRDFQQKEYPKEIPLKEMIILQNLDNKTLYNITFITQSLNTLNIKVDARDASIISHELITLNDLKTN
ncbi:MAG: hypothetical protein ABIJ08_07020 [Nanoarchaeota archaeon]